MEILLQNSKDMQLQVIDELTVTFKNTTHNFKQDYTGKFDENKAETQACYNKLTSVEQVLEGVEQVAVGKKNMIFSVKIVSKRKSRRLRAVIQTGTDF